MDFDGFEYELSHDAYQDPVRIHVIQPRQFRSDQVATQSEKES